MRFESLMWSILVMLLISIGWDGGSAQPLEKAELFEAADGGSTTPPPPKP